MKLGIGPFHEPRRIDDEPLMESGPHIAERIGDGDPEPYPRTVDLDDLDPAFDFDADRRCGHVTDLDEGTY